MSDRCCTEEIVCSILPTSPFLWTARLLVLQATSKELFHVDLFANFPSLHTVQTSLPPSEPELEDPRSFGGTESEQTPPPSLLVPLSPCVLAMTQSFLE